MESCNPSGESVLAVTVLCVAEEIPKSPQSNSFSVTCCLFGSRASTFFKCVWSLLGSSWQTPERMEMSSRVQFILPLLRTSLTHKFELFELTDLWIVFLRKVNWTTSCFLWGFQNSRHRFPAPQQCCQSFSLHPKLLRTVGLCCEKAISLGKDLIFLLFPSCVNLEGRSWWNRFFPFFKNYGCFLLCLTEIPATQLL